MTKKCTQFCREEREPEDGDGGQLKRPALKSRESELTIKTVRQLLKKLSRRQPAGRTLFSR
eukprot:scaffold108432_cov72-Cyclotella_meneghiniana.AAC.1